MNGVVYKKIVFILLQLIVFVVVTNKVVHAQNSPKDSVMQAIKAKRTLDSLNRVELKQKLQKQKDSLQLAIKTKRTADSLQRIKIVQDRLNERKVQDSILAFKKKFIKDSLEAAKNGITIRLDDLLKEKENEKARLKKLEEKIVKQRIEDSLLVVKKLAEEFELNRKKDSIAKANQIIEEQKKQLLIAEQKRIQDSISVAKKQEEEQKRLALEKLQAEQKRIQDSISVAKKQEEEQKRLALEKLQAEQKRIQDSISVAKKQEEEQKRFALEKLQAEQKRIQDSILVAKKQEEELLKSQQQLLFVKQKKYNDSLKNAQDSLKLVSKLNEEKIALAQKKYNDSLAVEQQNKAEQDQIAMTKLAVQQKKYNDSLNAMQALEKEKNNTVFKQYFSKVDTNLLPQNEIVRIKDSLETAERIRLQELKYTKQRIEDSLYFVSQKNTVVPAIIEEEIKTNTFDSIELIVKNDTIVEVKADTIAEVKKELVIKDSTIYYSTYSIQKRSTILSVNMGLSNYLGDLGGNSGVGRGFLYDNNFKKRTYMFGVSLTRRFKEAVGIRLSYNSGKVAGSDNDVSYKNENDVAYYRYKRNLDFMSKISEFSAIVELYPFKFFSKNTKLHRADFQPYILGGIGYYTFNPTGSFYDVISQDYVLVELHPLKTEGQGTKEYPDRKEYKLNQMNMPFGIGFNYSLGQKTALGFEFVGRKLFTDYLDDVSTTYIDPSILQNYFKGETLEIATQMTNKSNLTTPDKAFQTGEQRGNPERNDFYYSFNLKFSLQINNTKKYRLKTQ